MQDRKKEIQKGGRKERRRGGEEERRGEERRGEERRREERYEGLTQLKIGYLSNRNNIFYHDKSPVPLPQQH
jgi:hypothetical protein